MTHRATENEWFQKFEQEMIRDARRRRDEETARKRSEEDAKIRDLHFMKCPKCGHDLAPLKLSGITVDKCSHCEGLFFDRGELEELLLQKADTRRSIFRKLAGLFP